MDILLCILHLEFLDFLFPPQFLSATRDSTLIKYKATFPPLKIAHFSCNSTKILRIMDSKTHSIALRVHDITYSTTSILHHTQNTLWVIQLPNTSKLRIRTSMHNSSLLHTYFSFFRCFLSVASYLYTLQDLWEVSGKECLHTSPLHVCGTWQRCNEKVNLRVSLTLTQ